MRGAALIVLSTLVAIGARAQSPVPVSPGSPATVVTVSGRCPTFLWTEAQGAEAVDLVVYLLPDVGMTGPLERFLSIRLPGSAGGWTPSVTRCLEPGKRYAWSVRADRGELLTEWSEANLFEIAGLPSLTELEEAVAALRRDRDLARPPRPPAEGTIDAPAEPTDGFDRKGPVLHGPSVGVRPVPPPRALDGPTDLSLKLEGDLDIGGYLFTDGAPLLHLDQTDNLALGEEALVSMSEGVDSPTENTALGNRALYLNATGSRNTAAGFLALRDLVSGNSNTAVGSRALRSSESGDQNTAVGFRALNGNLDGTRNTAVGSSALRNGTTGSRNTAIGYRALREASGDDNVAAGYRALDDLTDGDANVAVGSRALFYAMTARYNVALGTRALYAATDAYANVAIGYRALYQNVSGGSNVAIGRFALRDTTGGGNVAIGPGAGSMNVGGSDNVFIDNSGSPGDGTLTSNNVIRLGSDQDLAFIAGVRGVTTGQPDAVAVMIDSAGQLGTASSSRRYKEAIRDMGAASSRLLDLRPVTFRYRRPGSEPPGPVQFGLIAEEVAGTLPDLVVYDDQGRPETVRYHLHSSLVLNELQKQHRQNQLQWLLIAGMVAAGVLSASRRARRKGG